MRLAPAEISSIRTRLHRVVAELRQLFEEEEAGVVDLEALREIRALQAEAEAARDLVTYLSSEAFMLDVVTRSTSVEAE